jgi:K+-transporting ATPase ATPase C chain
MTTTIGSQLRPAVVALLALTVVTGIIYPAAVTIVGQVAFNGPAHGSLIVVDGEAVGSALIGQTFDDPAYFWSRPSAAGDGYDARSSSGSNLSPTSRDLLARIDDEVQRLQALHGDAPIPVDLVTTSASGLDPHISVEAARYQAARVAEIRGIDLAEVQEAIELYTTAPILGFLGEPVVNVLRLNLELDGIASD